MAGEQDSDAFFFFFFEFRPWEENWVNMNAYSAKTSLGRGPITSGWPLSPARKPQTEMMKNIGLCFRSASSRRAQGSGRTYPPNLASVGARSANQSHSRECNGCWARPWTTHDLSQKADLQMILAFTSSWMFTMPWVKHVCNCLLKGTIAGYICL